VIAAVDIQGLAGDQVSGIHRQEGEGCADVLDRNETARRAFAWAFCKSSSKSVIPEAARAFNGPGEIAWLMASAASAFNFRPANPPAADGVDQRLY
jgi:hypothetical protein